MIPDNYDQWAAHDRHKESLLELLPMCDECGKCIQDDMYFDIEGEILCEKCMVRKYGRRTEDYE